jgi:hypothetical protein
MATHSLITLSLFFYSLTSRAAATPLDANQADIAQNPVIYKEAATLPVGKMEKDINQPLAVVAADSCPDNAACLGASAVVEKPHSITDQFVQQDGDSALQPFVVLVLIIAILFVFLSRKTSSTK